MLGILLAGIVATQVEILKLGASMGRAIEQTTTLTSENEQLRGSVAMLGDDQRIERLASAMGMVLPPPGAVGYLPVGPNADVSRALNNLHSPDPSAFVSLTPLVGDGALVTGQGTSTLPPPSGEPTVSTPSATSDTSASSTTTGSSAAQSSTSASGSAQGTATSTDAASTTPAPGTNTQSPADTSQSQTDTAQGQTDTTQSQTDTSQAPTGGGQTNSNGATDQSSQATTSGAAAIQPSNSNQPTAGG